MTCSENDGDTLMLSKEQLESSSTDEGSCCGSSTMGGGRVILKKGPWTTAEDALLISYVRKHGEGNWNAVQRHSGLLRCGKSCRLRWANHLRPHLKKGAFSPEEEQFIIQMHSKMGNRWARMAALLPGRTDNEIKNYWNTRVKRRSRAGLPLYPPKLSLQTSNENQLNQSASELSSGNHQNIGVLQGTMNGALEFRCHPHKANSGPLPSPPRFPDIIPVAALPCHGLGYCARSFLNSGANHFKQPWESETFSPGCHVNQNSIMVPAFEELPPSMNSETVYLNPGLRYPYDPDPENKNLASFICSTAGNPGNFSSSRLLPGAVKMELPSLQYPEADYIDWTSSSSLKSSYDAVDMYIQSPENVSVHSDCASPRNKGLLEDLVQESHAISSGKKQSFVDRAVAAAATASGTVKWEEIRDPTSPFCLSAVSLFNDCNPTITSTFDESSACETPMGDKQDKYTPNLPDFLRPDVLLGSGWLMGNSRDAGDSIAGALDENLREERAPVPVPVPPAGISSMASLEAYPWTNMPRVCQMSEH